MNSVEAEATGASAQVLNQLRSIIDPDLGQNIVECGFVRDLSVDESTGSVSFTLRLTTPACPVKDEFERDAYAAVQQLEWVNTISITMDADPPEALSPEPVPALKNVRHIIAVSSCKGGVGKSTVSVNLAYSLADMGAKVGLLDADVYGPSLPTMLSPDKPVLEMDPDTSALTPTEYAGVKAVSFGFTGQASAIMRGPMVSGLIQQLLTTSEWGELDYLVVDFPPGTGDIQLTLCQAAPFSAAVVVTTPQKLSFIDVAKGIRMFSKLHVPCVSVVENMSFFHGDDGKRYHPFGQGSGERVCNEFGVPSLFQHPIEPELSAAGDNGVPEVVEHPQGETAARYRDLAMTVVQETSKLGRASPTQCGWDDSRTAFKVVHHGETFHLDAATVRANDTSARSIDEWTQMPKPGAQVIDEELRPHEVTQVGNYAVHITWDDGFNQVASFDLLLSLQGDSIEEQQRRGERSTNALDVKDNGDDDMAASSEQQQQQHHNQQSAVGAL